jgi:hypothetical protein
MVIASLPGISQSQFQVTNSVGSVPKRTWTITRLGIHKEDGKYQKALDGQLGIIGNDYYKEEYIGMAIEQEYLRDTRYPVDGYKRTIMGKVTSNYFRNYASSDNDDDYHVIIEAMKNDPLFIKNKTRLESETNANTPFNIILGEIDIHQEKKPNFLIYRDDMPVRSIDYACLYGPWITDRGAYGNQTAHGTYFEIHPAEQIWWTEKRKNEIVYSLVAINDNSGRFDDEIDYDRGSGYIVSWTPKILKSVFAIPFAVKLSGSEKQFNLLYGSDKNVHPVTEPKTQDLKYQNKTLVRFVNWSVSTQFTEVEFDNVGIDTRYLASHPGDTLIKGFILLKSKIGSYQTSDVAGHLMTLVTETNNLTDKVHTASTLKLKVTLDNITCVSADDGDAYEDVTGFIGARIIETAIIPSLANHKPDNANTPLLWSRVDGNGLKLKKGQVQTINKTFTYDLDLQAILMLVADLNEDDNNDDSNPTMSDGIADGLAGWFLDPVKNLEEAFGGGNQYKDDKLEKFCVTCEETILPGNMTAGVPLKKKFKFASGGTLLEVNFTIMRER